MRAARAAVGLAMAGAVACGGIAPAHDGGGPGSGGADAGPSPDATPSADPNVWRPRTIYLAIPDRFVNGDPQNDALGAADCVDPASPLLFHGGDLRGLKDAIAYLAELGVGALWVTPLAAQVPRRNDSCGYHGYWADLADPADPIDASLEPRLGAPGDVDTLLLDLRVADILSILDVVVNHPGRGARVVAQRPDWFHAPDGCAALGPPVEYCPLSGLPDFAVEKPMVGAYVTRTTTAWLERYRFDGVRMDTAKHVPLPYFADDWLPAARAARPDAFVVAEVFSDGDPAQFAGYFQAGFSSVFHFPLRRALVDGIARGGSLDELASVMAETIGDLGLERALMMSTFLDNHDLPRFMSEAGDLDDAERVRRYEMALVALFTLPGIPQLYYGDELGMLGIWPENRRDMPAWAFDPALRAGPHQGFLGDPARTFALVARLIRLRRDHPALHAGGYDELWRPNGGKNNFAFHRADGGDRAVVILRNGDGASLVEVLFPGTPDGTIVRDAAGLGAPATATVAGGRIAVEMPGKSAAIYLP